MKKYAIMLVAFMFFALSLPTLAQDKPQDTKKPVHTNQKKKHKIKKKKACATCKSSDKHLEDCSESKLKCK